MAADRVTHRLGTALCVVAVGGRVREDLIIITLWNIFAIIIIINNKIIINIIELWGAST